MGEERKGIALITGATSGIGAAFAEAFAKRGYNLVVTGRRKEKINYVAESIRKKQPGYSDLWFFWFRWL